MAKVVWTEKASTHLQAIHEYISQDSPIYAERFVRSLVKATVKLEKMPFCGRIVPELENENLRELVFHNYRIVYSVANLSLSLPILAVMHCARDIIQVLDTDWELS